ncbi:MAG TPA: bifunctional adenosylcobinamide kinase/adenosylcobinamide-phosphate guanylyltransferase [Steroidobacteraceae bacterium]|jgi:adenosylcobinamide kinase/adenosylcobinamide-phosphate guanylyltransferase
MRSLLIGGVRSGKSSLAARWALQRSADVCVLVTGIAQDAEMTARIEAHRRARPPHWTVREEPIRLGHALRQATLQPQLVLVDCLTLWISNCLWPAATLPEADHALWGTERQQFLAALRSSKDVIVVSNEVGAGIVPENAVARLFRDEQGWLNQAVAEICDEVFLVTAALPLRLKG